MLKLRLRLRMGHMMMMMMTPLRRMRAVLVDGSTATIHG